MIFTPDEYIHKYNTYESGPFPRAHAWEFLYDYIWSAQGDWTSLTNKNNLDKTALQIGFYLANWGMFRGRSFLMYSNLNLFRELAKVLFTGKGQQLHDLSIVDFAPRAPNLAQNQSLFDSVIQKIEEIAPDNSWSNTLKSKILMGTWGECPALDTYYTIGLKKIFGQDARYRVVTGEGMTATYDLIRAAKKFGAFPTQTTREHSLKYPDGELLDMAVFQFGFEFMHGPKLNP